MNESAQDQLLDKIQLELEAVLNGSYLIGGSIERWRQDIPEVHLSFIRRIPKHGEYGKSLTAFINLESGKIELSLDFWDDDLDPGFRHWRHEDVGSIPFDFDRADLWRKLKAALKLLVNWTRDDLDRRDKLP